jgi:hypothetical protein
MAVNKTDNGKDTSLSSKRNVDMQEIVMNKSGMTKKTH